MLGMPSTRQMIWIAVVSLIAVGLVSYFSIRYRASLAGINPIRVGETVNG